MTTPFVSIEQTPEGWKVYTVVNEFLAAKQIGQRLRAMVTDVMSGEINAPIARNFEPLRILATNAKRQHMNMECDPDWVLKLYEQREELLAAAERILAKLDHPTASVNALDADRLRDAIAKARGEA